MSTSWENLSVVEQKCTTEKNSNGSSSDWKKNIATEKQIYTKDEECKNDKNMVNIKEVFLRIFISLKK